MDQETLKAVGYFDILRDLEHLCITLGGKEYAKSLQPYENYDETLANLKETTEAKTFYGREGDLPFIDFIGIEPIIEKIKVLSMVTGEELLSMTSVFSSFAEIKEIGDSFMEDFPQMNFYTSKISSFKDISEKIIKAVGPDGKLVDDASPLLNIVRREIKITYTRIQTILQSIVYSKDYEEVIQDQIITKRNGRYVIPVRQNSRPAFQYIIQGESSTRLTIFVEPISVVDLNNKLVDLSSKEKQEEERIILELEGLIQAKIDQILNSLSIIYKLDFIFGKGKLSLKMKSDEPELTDKNKIFLFEARNPFISEDKVIPINVEVGEDFRMLIITGPNTGGKTVTLKTVGLLVLMTESGLHIPAYSATKIGFFKNIYTDIGDEQSIQQNLSTFSSHMSRIINIMKDADKSTLVLIDELGAGTDPEEGAALGYAILEKLYNLKCLTIATTHHSKLKSFAYKFILSKNASVGFDIETLMPTYHLYIGIPGESHAFIIAQNLGVSEDVLESATKELSQDYIASKEIISKMSEEQKRIGESKEIIEKSKEETEELKKILEKKVQELDERKHIETKKAYEEARKMVQETKEKMNSILMNLDNTIKSQKMIQELKKAFQEEGEKVEQRIEDMEPKEKVDITGLEEGSLVYVPNFKRQGIILGKMEDKGKIVIQMGSIRATVSINDVQLIANAVYSSPKKEEKDEILDEISNLQVPMKLDLHGFTVEEAVEKLDKYLDSAYLVGMPFAYVIHGKGSGALKEAITDYLRKKVHVSHFYTGTLEEGGSGVTIVYLK